MSAVAHLSDKSMTIFRWRYMRWVIAIFGILSSMSLFAICKMYKSQIPDGYDNVVAFAIVLPHAASILLPVALGHEFDKYEY